MIQLSDKGMLKTEIGQNLGFLHPTASQIMTAKENFSNEK